MLDQKRVAKAQDSIRNLPISRNVIDGVGDLYEALSDYNSGALSLAGASSILEQLAQYTRYQTLFASTDIAQRQLCLSFTASLLWLGFDLEVKGRSAGKRISGDYGFVPTLGYQAPLLQSIGWVTMAEQMTSYIWTDFLTAYSATRNTLFGLPTPGTHDIITNFYLVHKPAWFTTMTTLPDPTIWQQHGYNPDADSMGPYWMLAQVWDDPDPTVVRNALQATRDLNIGTTFIKDNPPGKRVYIVDEFLLFYDYDIRSINMRRKLLGLPVVPVESYITDMDLPLDVLPFVVDDVFYPAYLKMCADIGLPPYEPENPVSVRFERDAIRVMPA